MELFIIIVGALLATKLLTSRLFWQIVIWSIAIVYFVSICK